MAGASGSTGSGPMVVVIEDDAVVLSWLATALSPIPALRPFSSLDEFFDAHIDRGHGLVMVLGPSQATEEVLDRVGALVRSEQDVGALLVVAEPNAPLLRLVVRAGLEDAVPLERIDEELLGSVTELGGRLAASMTNGHGPEVVDRSAGVPRPSRVVTVFAPKGGVGKSVVTVNLSAAFARRARQPVVLVDADLQFGDAAVMLRLKPPHGISEAVAAGDRLDAVLLESLLVREERSGVLVLAAPTDPVGTQRVTPAAMSGILGVLREMGSLVVIDTPPVLDDVVLQLLAESDHIVYVVGLDVPSIKNARLGLQAMEMVGVPLERVVLVLNRADSRVHLAQRDVEKILEMRVDAGLPSDALVTRSVNKGIPAVLEFDRSRFAGKIFELADLILASTPARSQP